MDERFALTRHVATKIINHLNVKECMNGNNKSCWHLQQVNNALILFPNLLETPKCRDQIYDATLAATRRLIKQSSKDSDLWCIYAIELVHTVSNLLAHFSSGQQRLMRQSITSVDESIDQQSHVQDVERVRQLFFVDSVMSEEPIQVKVDNSVIQLNHLPRLRCTACNLSNQPFYCTRCYAVLHPASRSVIPCVVLPFELHIVVHPDYDMSKSTACHTRLLCDPSQVHIHVWPVIPQFDDALLLFPSESSVSIDQARGLLSKQSSEMNNQTNNQTNNQSALKRLVMIEATWPQANQIMSHPHLKQIIQIKLNVGNTRFWRHQSISPSYLSSIETIHAFTTEWAGKNTSGGHQQDDLLWLFNLGWQRVRAYYKERLILMVPPPLEEEDDIG